MKRVYLRYYDEHNLGDDLFARIVVERYENKFYVISNKSKFLRSFDNVEVFSNRFVLRLSRAIEKYLRMPNILKNIYANKSDLYLYIGGSVFIDNGDESYWQSERRMFNSLKIPYYIIGANYGPEINGWFKGTVASILEGSADVCFRDTTSFNDFRDIESVRRAGDVVFSLDTTNIEIKEDKLVLMSIIETEYRFSAKTSEAYDRMIMSLTDMYVKEGYKILYVSFCELEGDKKAIDRIKSRLDPDTESNVRTYSYLGNIDEALSLIASCDLVVGTRFHSIILGLVFGKKVVPIAYGNKTKNYLSDANFAGAMVDINDLDNFDCNDFGMESITTYDATNQINSGHLQFRELDKVLKRRKL